MNRSIRFVVLVFSLAASLASMRLATVRADGGDCYYNYDSNDCAIGSYGTLCGVWNDGNEMCQDDHQFCSCDGGIWSCDYDSGACPEEYCGKGCFPAPQ